MTTSADDRLQPWTGRAILHVDLDAFFAAVEQLDHPEWRGRPVIVGGDPARRGVVSTASYEARAFGVRSAMPSVRAAALCPDAIWTRGSFARYGEVSRAVMAIFSDITPRVQPVSIDEAFLDVTPGRYSAEHPVELAMCIRTRVAALGVTASVGVATSKSVAKVASDFDKPDGLTIVWPGQEAGFLAPLPVSALSGIGPRTFDRLSRLGVRAIGDLAALDDATAVSILGHDGPGWVARASGVDDSPVRERPDVKSVSNERTFSQDVRTPSEIDGAISELVAKVANRLRSKHLAGRTVTVKLRFSDFTTRTVRTSVADPTDDPQVICGIARDLIANAWTPGVGLRLLGVGVSGFSGRAVQLDLLASPGPPDGTRSESLTSGIDAVRRRFGEDALRFGAELSTHESTEEDG